MKRKEQLSKYINPSIALFKIYLVTKKRKQYLDKDYENIGFQKRKRKGGLKYRKRCQTSPQIRKR